MQSKAERLALIREAAKKFKTPVVTSRQTPRKDNEDERYWTDASKYANQYYGETFRETVRHDKEWD